MYRELILSRTTVFTAHHDKRCKCGFILPQGGAVLNQDETDSVVTLCWNLESCLMKLTLCCSVCWNGFHLFLWLPAQEDCPDPRFPQQKEPPPEDQTSGAEEAGAGGLHPGKARWCGNRSHLKTSSISFSGGGWSPWNVNIFKGVTLCQSLMN